MTQMGRGKPLPVCKQMMDCSICPDLLVPLGRNQSIHSITQLCDSSPLKGPSEAVGFGVMTLNVVRINLPRVPGEQAQETSPNLPGPSYTYVFPHLCQTSS